MKCLEYWGYSFGSGTEVVVVVAGSADLLCQVVSWPCQGSKACGRLQPSAPVPYGTQVAGNFNLNTWTLHASSHRIVKEPSNYRTCKSKESSM